MNIEIQDFVPPNNINEAKKLFDRKQDYLDKAHQKYEADCSREVSLIIENQHLYTGLLKEQVSKNPKDTVKLAEAIEWFYERSPELVKESFKGFVGFDLISVQPMIGPGGLVFFGDGDNLDKEDVVAKTRLLPITVDKVDFTREDGIQRYGKYIRREITREILKDLRNNVGTAAKVDQNIDDADLTEIKGKIAEVSSLIRTKTLQGQANWLVVPLKLARRFAGAGMDVMADLSYISETTMVGTLGEYTVYVDLNAPDNEILMGRAGWGVNGYFFCPYVFVTIVERANGTFSLMTRYSKKLVSAKNYAKLVYGEGSA